QHDLWIAHQCASYLDSLLLATAQHADIVGCQLCESETEQQIICPGNGLPLAKAIHASTDLYILASIEVPVDGGALATPADAIIRIGEADLTFRGLDRPGQHVDQR